MNNFFDVLRKSMLFDEISEDDFNTLLKCLSYEYKTYDKGDYVFIEGTHSGLVGFVISGRIHVVKEDFWGNRTIVVEISPSSLFCETFSYSKISIFPVSVCAADKCEILLFDYKKLISTCSSNCNYHKQLINNIIHILATKNAMLTQKIILVTQRNTRDKLLSYLSTQATNACCSSFDIEFNRQELADYLSVDRSAMSKELGKMRDEGILTFNKNHFSLI